MRKLPSCRTSLTIRNQCPARIPPLYTGGVGAWYTIGLCLGLGLAFGVVLSGILSGNAAGMVVAAIVGAALGAVVGYGIGDLAETVAGGVAGIVGALSAAAVVKGALRRGATRMGLATFLCAAGVLIVLVALIPAAGYLLVLVLPVLALRMRGRQAARYAGLRTLAR
jgi:hypothetical protein